MIIIKAKSGKELIRANGRILYEAQEEWCGSEKKMVKKWCVVVDEFTVGVYDTKAEAGAVFERIEKDIDHCGVDKMKYMKIDLSEVSIPEVGYRDKDDILVLPKEMSGDWTGKIDTSTETVTVEVRHCPLCTHELKWIGGIVEWECPNCCSIWTTAKVDEKEKPNRESNEWEKLKEETLDERNDLVK